MPNYRPLLPNIFTVANIACGFSALVAAAGGEPTKAAWLILLAGLMDAFDGKVARLAGGSSDMGKEFDSLADFCSFGLAPAFLIDSLNLALFGKWNWIIGLVYIVASGYRLARFNLLATSDEKKDFLGLPVPFAAVTLASYIIFCYDIWGGVIFDEYTVAMMIILAGLMVSQVEYYALPDNFYTRENWLKLLYIFLLALALIFEPRLLLFPLFVAYIIYGMVREVSRMLKTAASHNSRHQPD